jgi:hypothetical protein
MHEHLRDFPLDQRRPWLATATPRERALGQGWQVQASSLYARSASRHPG